MQGGRYDDTICWYCAKACTRGCSWSENFTPVEGWDAIPNAIRNDKIDGVKTYKVRNCPEFVKDRKGRDPEELLTENCVMLVEKVLEVAKDDYVKSEPDEQHMIEKFIRGRGASRLHMISDPEGVIRKLKKDAYEYRKKKAQKSFIRRAK